MRRASAGRQLWVGVGLQQRLAHGVEATGQLVGVDALQPLEHHDAAPLAILDDQRPHFGERPARGTPGRSPSSSMRCSVTSSSRTVPSACVRRRILRCAFPDFAVLEPFGQDRNGLAQAARRHARLVDADVLSGDGGGQLAPQCARAALEEADQR